MSKRHRMRMDAVKPTLAHVATMADVSSTTASRVLNNRPNCWASDETRRRILEAAEELGYRPNLAAKSLRSGKTRNVGLIMSAIGGRRIDGFHEAASEAGYVTFMSFNVNNPEVENQLIRDHLDHGIDGLAIYPSDSGVHEELRGLIARDFPVVVFDGVGRFDIEADDVSTDYEAIGRLQAEHLLDLGRRNICIASPKPSAKVNDIREHAIAKRLAEAGLTPVWLRLTRTLGRDTSSVEQVYPQMLEFMKRRGQEIDGLCGYDAVASLAVRALHACGRSVPGDVAVVGAGNTTLATCGSMALTSIDASDRSVGLMAFDLLVSRLRGDNSTAAKQRKGDVSLIARESSVTVP